MRFILLLIGVIFICNTASSQRENLGDINPEVEFENIHVEKISDDSLSSTFLIWVKSIVAPHYHAEHTEQVYVLEGTGIFTMNGSELTIEPGDLITIPKGAVHSVKVTSDTPMKVLSVQSPQFTGDDRIFVED